MHRRLLPEAEHFAKQNQRRRMWRNFVRFMACVVVFCTTYALILPAITMEKNCDLEEHIHTEGCYVQITAREEVELTCSYESLKVHIHTKECYDAERSLECGFADYLVHKHEASCFDESDTLICLLPEIVEHEHTQAECYSLTETVPELICEKKVIKLHSHSDECYEIYSDENDAEKKRLICSETVVLEHVHSDSCVTIREKPVDTKALTCTETQEHIHSDLCYGSWELTCETEEHTHVAACNGLTEEEQARVDEVIAMIEGLPTYDEMETTLVAYEDAEDWENYELYFTEIGQSGLKAYNAYSALPKKQQALVYNADKLMDLSSVWSVATLEWNELGVRVCARDSINCQNPSGQNRAIMVYGRPLNYWDVNAAGNITDPNAIWAAVDIRESSNGRLYVDYISGQAPLSNFLGWQPQYEDKNGDGINSGFILLFPVGYYNPDNYIEVGDLVTVEAIGDFEYYHRSPENNPDGLCYVYFGSSPKVEKNNTSKLTVVPGADTSELIQVNLYDYGSDANNRYNANHEYLGFQQDYGTKSIGNSFNTLSFNFGNNITADMDAGHDDITTGSGAINQITGTYGGTNYGPANIPISGAIKNTLTGRYPTLTAGMNLDIYFHEIGENVIGPNFMKKMNTANVNGLFQYNPTTGEYTFDSRKNHAQFNAQTNSFTLYEQIFSPNVIMYPFGNFMPFNDITTQCVQASQLDRSYFLEIADSARYKSENGYRSEYGTLANVLQKFISLMDTAVGNRDWTPGNAVMAYFEGAFPGEMSTSKLNNLLPQIYTLDYDEPSDFYFGMEMRMNLTQPKGGMTGTNNEHPMKFDFAGDDDVWVFIDDVLFMDLSGIHRHVGGQIDFVNGVVNYYAYKSYIDGEIQTTPYKTETFAQILTAAGKSTDVLNEKGTFKDYSTHTFDFFYTERGSGSSVCRMNFNFPLMKQNAISVSKELSVDDDTKKNMLGEPDFRFQIMKADSNGNKTNEPFIGSGVTYTIYDSANNEVGTGTTGANGIFTLKAGQRAEFTEISENLGKYYVRELLEADDFAQFGTITVDGSSTTVNNNLTVGSETFTGLESSVKDVSDGTSQFRFDNQVVFNKLGSLSVGKVLESLTNADSSRIFDMNVTLDGTPLAVGTEYTLSDGTRRTVSTAGVISLKSGQTATIANILSGTRFTVSESSDSAKDYIVTYEKENTDEATVSADKVSGVVRVDTDVKVIVTNAENSALITIPVTKTLSNGAMNNGIDRSYTFNLQRTGATDGNGTAVNLFADYKNSKTVTVSGAETAAFAFELQYTAASFADVTAFPVTITYMITESAENVIDAMTDPSVYVATVTVSKEANNRIKAELTSLKKDGSKVNSVAFVNTLISNLVLKKIVDGGQIAQTGSAFTFRVTLTDASGTPLVNRNFSVTSSGGVSPDTTVTTGADGSFTFTDFRHNDVAVIHGLPVGTRWTIREENTEGFIVSWKINDKISGASNTANGDISADGTQVVFTNTSTYVLPETGAGGTQQYTMVGMVLILFSAAYLMYRFKAHRREVF